MALDRRKFLTQGTAWAASQVACSGKARLDISELSGFVSPENIGRQAEVTGRIGYRDRLGELVCAIRYELIGGINFESHLSAGFFREAKETDHPHHLCALNFNYELLNQAGVFDALRFGVVYSGLELVSTGPTTIDAVTDALNAFSNIYCDSHRNVVGVVDGTVNVDHYDQTTFDMEKLRLSDCELTFPKPGMELRSGMRL